MGGDQDSGREGDGLWVPTPSPCLLPGIIACFQGRACACHILDFILLSEFGLGWRDRVPRLGLNPGSTQCCASLGSARPLSGPQVLIREVEATLFPAAEGRR